METKDDFDIDIKSGDKVNHGGLGESYHFELLQNNGYDLARHF